MADRKCCFVVSQIGGDDSAERIHADWFLEEIVRPVFETRPNFDVERGDTLQHPGLIDAQVIHKLLTAELVIADISGLNPNVFYEIGIRHMQQSPIIHMHEVGEEIPFDIKLYRSIPYSRKRPRDLREAREKLASMVESALAPDHQVENPVTAARGRFNLEQNATPPQQILLQQMQAIEKRLFAIEAHWQRSATLAKISDFSDSYLPSIEDINYISPYSVGDVVAHTKFGVGQVTDIEGTKLTIKFVKSGIKRVIDSFVSPVRPAPS